MEDNNNKPEKDENAFEDPIKKALSEPETPLSSSPPVEPSKFGAPRVDLSLLNSKVGGS